MSSIFRLFIVALLVVLSFLSISAQTSDKTVLIQTTLGDIKIVLYRETPLHTENFIKLAGEGFYDNQLFHRVINHFMIQAGDPNSINAQKGEILGNGGPGYTTPAEFHPDLYHKKGAVAAARHGDDVNPERASSGSQFYIVHGKVFTNNELDQFVQKNLHIRFTDKQRKIYTSIGGTPHLDYAYTVFGEVIEGFEVLDKIAAVATDQYDRPLEDVSFKIKIID